jgi:hypothetical protein
MEAMAHRRSMLIAVTATAGALLTACASGPLPTASPSPRASATPSPTPTPDPPDTQSVQVTATGVGAWQLVAVPVAVLHNQAVRHGATGVVVHFTTVSSGGKPLHALDSVAVNLPPSATIIVTADCTDTCNNAASTVPTVTVGNWVESAGIGFVGSGVSYRCTAGCGGRESGEVVATLTAGGTVGAGAVVTAFADCVDAGGAIIGGGSVQIGWAGGATAPVDIPVIVNRPPSTCNVSASTGW